ncbi:MAG TPA: TIGR03560 family F420-dependent LLM class oxidoreductase [Dehalococcoidia bacterium]|nr:TIGR03560 family F420-dependent LLM class oxidoreductase [Dehalococcoidia bacterium]
MPKIELGVHTGQQDIELDELRRLWRYCDENGFDWISVWDHFYEAPNRDNEGPTYEAVALMAALALETKRPRIGCLVFCMNYRNPALLAKSLTTIDHLSGGRVTVGLGAGWHVQEHQAFGYDFPPVRERLDRLSEGVRIIRGMLTREQFSFQGKYYRVDNVRNNPKPLQSRMPIIVGGGGEQRTLRIAARRADGWNVPYIGPDVFAHKSKVLDMWCEKLGRDPGTIEKSVNLHFLMSSRGPSDTSRLRPGAAAGGLSGEPQQVIDKIGEYIDGGAQRVNIAIRPPVDWEALQEYVEDVMPAFR